MQGLIDEHKDQVTVTQTDIEGVEETNAVEGVERKSYNTVKLVVVMLHVITIVFFSPINGFPKLATNDNIISSAERIFCFPNLEGDWNRLMFVAGGWAWFG